MNFKKFILKIVFNCIYFDDIIKLEDFNLDIILIDDNILIDLLEFVMELDI